MTKISELNDSEILDFLMTSEYEEEFKQEEMKYFLTKWRYFYRILHGRNKITNDELEVLTINNKKDLVFKDVEINKLKKERDKKERDLKNLKDRKLTFMERWTGRIKK